MEKLSELNLGANQSEMSTGVFGLRVRNSVLLRKSRRGDKHLYLEDDGHAASRGVHTKFEGPAAAEESRDTTKKKPTAALNSLCEAMRQSSTVKPPREEFNQLRL